MPVSRAPVEQAPVLTTHRTRLRPVEPSDVPDLRAMRADPAVHR